MTVGEHELIAALQELLTPRGDRVVRWVGDDARFAKRLGRTSPPFPHLDVVDGAKFDGPDFPLVYPRLTVPAQT